MTTDDAPSLAAQCEEVRDRLRAQRQRIALELAPATPTQNHFPRSMTMRLLIRRPELIGQALRLAARLIRSRRGGLTLQPVRAEPGHLLLGPR